MKNGEYKSREEEEGKMNRAGEVRRGRETERKKEGGK